MVILLAAANLLLHLLTANRYGIFRDELYYLACSEHLQSGYVDQPPLIAFIAWFARHVFGESLIALRLLPAVAGALTVWLAAQLAKEMGGGKFAQGVAALATFAVPLFLIFDHWLTMNAFEPLVWLGAAWCVARAINRSDARYWLWFGVLVGVGMELKYTVLFFAVSVVIGMLFTSHRRFLKSKWIWIGAVVAFLIFLPNLLWLVKHDFPFLELMRNIRHSQRDVTRGPVAFVLDQIMLINPVLAPLWIGGLVWLLMGRVRTEVSSFEFRVSSSTQVSSSGLGVSSSTEAMPTRSDQSPQLEARNPKLETAGRYRIFAYTYLIMLGTMIVLKGKNYYLGPVYPILLAAGAIGFERLTSRVSSVDADAHSSGKELPIAAAVCRWIRIAYAALIILSGAVLAPLCLPILAPETYIRYQHALGFEPPKAENQNTGPLPQHFADEFGWEDMTREVAKVYNALPPDERARTAIFANSYGQAGAIDFFGPRYGLPKAISNHQSYWYWGPRDYDGSIVIVLGSDGEGDREHFKTVDEMGHTFHPYSRRDEHFPILLCRGLNQDLHALWPSIKKWN